jgi:hypothetical protein
MVTSTSPRRGDHGHRPHQVIDGVRTTVVWERDHTEGELEEAGLAFFAQDNDANVWHMGEYPEEYEEGPRWPGLRPGSPAWRVRRRGSS